jgi:hypothetical protein
MAFVKRGEGKIISVIDDEDLTEQQKKSVKSREKMTKESGKAEKAVKKETEKLED